MAEVRTGFSVVPDDGLYCRNMAALFRSDGRLAQLIDQTEPDGSVVLEPARRGGLTASVLAEDGRRVYLHSRVDPLEEARSFVASADLDDNFCFVVSGFGLGYHLRALAEKLTGEAFLLVAEPNLQVLKAALEHVDLADLFEQNRCVILQNTDKTALQEILEPRNLLLSMGTQFLSFPPGERLAPQFHARVRKMIADHLSYCRMSVVTMVTNARITCRNVVNNLPAYLSTPPIDILRDRFRGCPGVVIAAGPSLRRQIDLLRQLQGRAVLITVQTTFKTLLDCGIVPDFVTALDYHEMSRRFFEGIGPDPRTHLVVEPKVSWHVLDCYRGPTSVLDSPFARLCVGDALAARDGLKPGATVAHLAFYLAVYLGCEPIILVGQDLAYTNHVYYMPGVAMHELWRPQLNRFCTIENMEWERIGRSRNILLKGRDIHGREVYTDEQLFTYLLQFEGDFGHLPGRVIDATEGGLPKSGARVMPLAEVAARYCGRPIPGTCFDYLTKTRWRDPSRLPAAIDELEKRREEIADMADLCRQMLAVLDRLGGLLDRPDEFDRGIIEVDALRLKIEARHRSYLMISAVAQLAELRRYRADRRLKRSRAEGVERARRQLERDRGFVQAMVDGAEVIDGIIREGLDRLRAAVRAAEESAGG